MPSSYPACLLKGKKVLIVEDVVLRGLSVSAVVNWSRKYNPSEIYFATIIGHKKDLRDIELIRYKDSENVYIFRGRS